MTTKPMAPTIHLNGTSREDLTSAYMNAVAVLRSAVAALEITYPNGRDYYVQGASAISVAMQEHQSRVKRVHDVLQEVCAIVEAIDQQPGRR